MGLRGAAPSEPTFSPVNAHRLHTVPPRAGCWIEFQFLEVVSAIAYSILESRLALAASADSPLPHNQTVERVWNQWRSLPPHLAWPLLALTLVLDAGCIVSHGSRIRRMPLNARNQFLDRCRNSNWSALRDWTQFFDALVVFAAFSNLRVPIAPSNPRLS